MDKNMVERVEKEAIAGCSKKDGSKKNILVIFMGGDRNLDDSLNAVRELAQSNEVRIIATRAAASVIGVERMRNSTAVSNIIIDNGSHDPIALSSWPDLVVIAALTLNGLAKIANLITDTLQTNIVVRCLERRVPLIVARDAVFYSRYPEHASNSGISRKIESYISDLKNLGITVMTSKSIAKEVGLKVGYSAKKNEVTHSAAGEVFSVPITKLYSITDTCSEFKDGEDCASRVKRVEKKTGSASATISVGVDQISECSCISAMQIAPYIDHTLLRANAIQEEIVHLCEEAKKYKFASVCVNPAYVSMCSRLLRGSGVMVCTVIGFPLGATTSTVKAVEARDAIANGADEIDMVINVGAVKSGKHQLALDDIKAVRKAARGKTLKVIIETAYLSKDEKIWACQLSKEAGADFVKTSTGFGPSGATTEDIKLIREIVGPSMGIKASGGIRSIEDASKMLAAGATRVGASASVAIMLGKDAGSGY